jgi:hypothetical protein
MSEVPVYASDRDAAPDAEFVPGELRHLVAGNRGRLLDARRTPVSVVDVASQRGSFTVRIDAFEDRGARWELGLEEIGRFQFARDAITATGAALAALVTAAARFDRELVVECDREARADALVRLRGRRDEAAAWLRERAPHLAAEVDVDERIRRRAGEPALCALLEGLLTERDLHDLERDFATGFVTNPRAGEIVKGHAIVLAELGLCAYRGRAPRDPQLFAARRARERRADHLLWRLAFTAELWRALGRRELDLYRAAAADAPLQPAAAGTFVSATFSARVAEDHFRGGPSTRFAAIWRQPVPAGRALMTFLETRAMNERFHEAEAVLLADPANPWF